MRRTTPSLLEELDTLTAAARRRHPHWHVMIDAVRETAAAAADPLWTDAAASARLASERSADAPILDGAEITVPVEALVRLLASLGESQSREEALRLVEASIRQAEPPPSTQVAFAAKPLLQALARVHASRIPPHWSHGYCPVCGAWPLLSELVGIDRARHLRCGRCLADWQIPWLECPYCREHDHVHLSRLVPEKNSESKFVEACSTCGGYIKTITTLLPSKAVELALKDLDTVELDIAALDHGRTRPADPGHPIQVRLTSS
jgi:FdhE protein